MKKEIKGLYINTQSSGETLKNSEGFVSIINKDYFNYTGIVESGFSSEKVVLREGTTHRIVLAQEGRREMLKELNQEFSSSKFAKTSN